MSMGAIKSGMGVDATALGGSEYICSGLGELSSEAATAPLRTEKDSAYPVDTGPAVAQLLRRFNGDRRSIPVSFRELVPWIKVGERGTHYLHSYPAKLLPQIAHFFLASKLLASRDDVVLDPFAGAGTVPLEAVLSGRRAIHADVNPLAKLITTTKVARLDDEAIAAAASTIRHAFSRIRARSKPDVVNLDHWYDEATIRALVRLRAAIDQVADAHLRPLLQTTFSATARKVSHADPRFSVPVRRHDKGEVRSRNVLETFIQGLEVNRQRFRELDRLLPAGVPVRIDCAGDDARSLKGADGNPLADGSVGLVLTSPPYAGAQKYVRATSLSLGWLGLAGSRGLTALERRTIGREHFPKADVLTRPQTGIPEAEQLLEVISNKNALRAAICANYLVEMRSALCESVRVLKQGGYMVLVIGDNTVCGQRFPSSEYLRFILEEMGMETKLVVIDDIRSRGLITRRAATAGVIVSEWVLVLRKASQTR
ncbi:MAG: hypothetical protein J0I47_02115 [Sphingomonas sp.]|uniref:hypothetical protein n=1 Tax=Sphingomonas sp. TaxID=28214 RepID=UPI001AC975E5|nr:hypothetical protein [Sphingomonas sp.]MBN8807024.1 hypothetical protein [Sphingomonas sp.]